MSIHTARPAIGLMLMLGLAQLSLGAQVTARFDPPAKTVGLGDVFTIDIVADITDPVLGFGLDLGFDGSILSLAGSPALGPLWQPATAADGDGLAGLAFPDSISGIGILLATLTFSADDIGTAPLTLSVTPGDLTEGFPLDPTGFATVTHVAGNVEVIPEPLTISLLVLGGVAITRRRRR